MDFIFKEHADVTRSEVVIGFQRTKAHWYAKISTRANPNSLLNTPAPSPSIAASSAPSAVANSQSDFDTQSEPETTSYIRATSATAVQQQHIDLELMDMDEVPDSCTVLQRDRAVARELLERYLADQGAASHSLDFTTDALVGDAYPGHGGAQLGDHDVGKGDDGMEQEERDVLAIPDLITMEPPSPSDATTAQPGMMPILFLSSLLFPYAVSIVCQRRSLAIQVRQSLPYFLICGQLDSINDTLASTGLGGPSQRPGCRRRPLCTLNPHPSTWFSDPRHQKGPSRVIRWQTTLLFYDSTIGKFEVPCRPEAYL